MDYQNDKLGMTKWKDGIKVYVGETLSGKLTFKNLTTMRNSYEGHYSYDKDVVGNWNATAMGVYYCGYIDGNNLYQGVKSSNWKIDFYRFRRWLSDKYGIKRRTRSDASYLQHNKEMFHIKDILNIYRISVEKNIAPSEMADMISKKVLDDQVQSIEEAFEQLKRT